MKKHMETGSYRDDRDFVGLYGILKGLWDYIGVIPFCSFAIFNLVYSQLGHWVGALIWGNIHKKTDYCTLGSMLGAPFG